MSYILDALRKAEREKDVRQIPTLTTVHETPAPRSAKHFWPVFSACTVFVLLLGYIGFLLLRPAARQIPAPTGTGNTTAGAQAASASTRTTEPVPMLTVPPETLQPKSLQGIPSGNASSGRSTPALQQAPKKAESVLPAAKELNQQQATVKAAASEIKEAPPAPAITPPSKPLSFREAVLKMNMTVLFYAETKSERMVFIDGRRYAEGEYVDGQYLLESIAPEGAWLSYQGDRVILRAKSK